MSHPATAYEPRTVLDPRQTPPTPAWLKPFLPHARIEIQPRCVLCHTPVSPERHYCATCTLDLFVRPATLARRLYTAGVTLGAQDAIRIRVKHGARHKTRAGGMVPHRQTSGWGTWRKVKRARRVLRLFGW